MTQSEQPAWREKGAGLGQLHRIVVVVGRMMLIWASSSAAADGKNTFSRKEEGRRQLSRMSGWMPIGSKEEDGSGI
jgi:hypothetical protein